MEKKYLIVNPGSASHKFALFGEKEEIFRAHLEKESSLPIGTFSFGGKEEKENLTDEIFSAPALYIVDKIKALGIVAGAEEISAIGLRVVAPGAYFTQNRVVDDEYVKKLEEASEEASLHTHEALEALSNLRKIFPNTPICGISDSAFHSTMLPEAKHYAITDEVASKFNIFRYGYHGISIASIVQKIKEKTGSVPEKVIVCHLGGGSSITALKGGKSLDTSMGATPTEGVPMATRVGDIDSGAVIYLAERMGFELKKLEHYFNFECGLKGISGASGDIRELLKLESEGNEKAKLALDMFVHAVKKYIGAYFALLNGLDMLVFSGTIGERSDIMRERIVKNMQYLGLEIDPESNKKTIAIDGFIGKNDMPVKIEVFLTEEMAEIALEMKKLL